MKTAILVGALASCVSLFAAAAAAQESEGNQYISRDQKGNLNRVDDAAGFGAAKQLAISTDAALSFERRTMSNTDGAVTTLSILPAADYFVLNNLSVGGFIGVRYQKAGNTKATSFMIGPRVGYNIELSKMLSVWPKIGFSYSRNKVKSDVDGNDVGVEADLLTATTKNNALALNLFVPVMLHAAPHFFAGLGPFLDTDLNGDDRVTIWGVRLTIGGWL